MWLLVFSLFRYNYRVLLAFCDNYVICVQTQKRWPSTQNMRFHVRQKVYDENQEICTQVYVGGGICYTLWILLKTCIKIILIIVHRFFVFVVNFYQPWCMLPLVLYYYLDYAAHIDWKNVVMNQYFQYQPVIQWPRLENNSILICGFLWIYCI